MQIEALSSASSPLAIRLLQEMWDDYTLADAQEDCERILGSKQEDLFLAKEGENYIGFIYLNLRHDYVEGSDSSPVAYIEGIYVRPAWQGSGIGRQLVEFGAQWGKTKGASEYASDAELNNLGSIAFHQKLGFAITNRIVCFIKNID